MITYIIITININEGNICIPACDSDPELLPAYTGHGEMHISSA